MQIGTSGRTLFARWRAENVSFKLTFCGRSSAANTKKVKGMSCSLLFHYHSSVNFFPSFISRHMFQFLSSHRFCDFFSPRSSFSLRCPAVLHPPPTVVIYSCMNSSPLTRVKPVSNFGCCLVTVVIKSERHLFLLAASSLEALM